MKEMKLNSKKLKLYKEKITSLSNDEKVNIVGGNDSIDTNILSIFNCNTKTNKCPIDTDDLGSRKSCEPSGFIDCDMLTINP